MEANELRIGNLLESETSNCLFTKGIIEVDFSTFQKISLYDCLKNLKAIPLTEEWLLKFGFKYNNPTYEWYDKSAVFFIQVNYLGFDLIAKFHNQVIKEIKYVHELQNLYFALTGKELAKV